MNKKHLPTVIYLTAIILLGFLIAAHFFSCTLLKTDDSQLVLVKLICMKKAWAEGQIFPRWAADMVFGYGYPVFNFYQPFFIQIATVLSFITKNPIAALNGASILVYTASGLTMFLFVAALWGEAAGFLSAVAYMFFPYHIIDLYVRGANAELTAFAILPLMLWALLRLSQRLSKRYMLALTVSVALLSITHNISMMLFLPWFCIFGLVLMFTGGTKKLEFFKRAVFSAALGLGLTAFFWIPAFIEKKYVQIEKLYTGQYDFHNFFLNVQKLCHFVWNYKGPAHEPSGMVYELGIIHLIAVLLAVGLALTQPFNRSKAILVLMGVLALSSVVMVLPASSWFWEHLGLLKFVQFPWRFLMLTALAFSVLIGSIALRFQGRRQIAVVAFLAGLLVAFNIIYCQPMGMVKVKLRNNTLDVKAYPPNETGEFLPVEFKQLLLPPTGNAADIRRGQGEILAHHQSSSIKHQFVIRADTDIVMSFNSFYFPGWTILEGKKNVPIIHNPYGLIFFQLSPGEHHLDIYLGMTSVRVVGTVLSFLSVLVLLLLIRRI